MTSRSEFDFVVVGGGTAGLTMAKRLAEDRNISVAVVEAGMHYQVAAPLLQSIPGADVTFVGADEYIPTVDWGFRTSADPASGNKKRRYARGKCLGGSSARNFMIYQRPTVETLDRWAAEVHDASYSFENFLPHFKKSTHFTAPDDSKRGVESLYSAKAFEDHGGPLNISYPNFPQPFSEYMRGALNEIGIPTVQDFNSGSLLGCQYSSATINPSKQTRESSQTSFLRSAKRENLQNLAVFTRCMAKRILFDDCNKATGVAVRISGKMRTLRARREVILSAGAFQSPQLLMVSGLGPAEQLQQFGIPVIADLPGVGQNMQDHIFFGPAYRVKVNTLTKVANNPLFLLKQLFNYLRKKGPLTNNVADFLGWEKLPAHLRSELSAAAAQELAQFPSDWPEIEYLSGAGYVGDWSGLTFKQPRDGYQYATILAALVAPLSRGSVVLNSPDTSDLPTINTAYLQSATDQAVAVAAYKRVRQAWASSAMQEIVIGEEYFPGTKIQSDDEILEVIRNSLQTVWHASCTCKMGIITDEMAVVDSDCRVYGVSGLRVVDASAFPFLPPGHPQSSVYALAEKIADLIKRGE